MDKVLVTGSTGFLGEYVVNELISQGIDLRLLVRNPAEPKLAKWANTVEIVEGDLLDIVSLTKALDGISRAVHIAALVSFARKDAKRMRHINVTGSSNLINLSLEFNLEKFVFVSSIAALGRSDNGQVINEETRWQKSPYNTAYGYSKYLSENEVLRGIEEGLNAVSCHPGVILGAGDWTQGSPNLFDKVYKGLPFYPQGANGFISAEDVAKAIALLLNTPKTNHHRYILTAENMNYKDFFEKVAKAFNKKAPSWRLSFTMAKFIGYIFEHIANLKGAEPIISVETAKSSACPCAYDSSRFANEFNFKFTPIDKTIEQIASYYLKIHLNK